ncbi:MAG TPA: SAM-dependent chlorinase/fluorinase [Anaerolineaceae bacterium]|nr:SAM-dependent chlorinase/fluorinase [Anaerolineaceae bacterium]HPN52716.1 SAM-dependent chlorinase/fluorinase [Anaerolineaceae bacterium]
MKTPIITLTTDFGSADPEVAALKGVMWKIAPTARLVDLSHEITPHQVLEGALLLDRCVRFFPAGTIHVAVVDPGVGMNRRVLAACIHDQFFVGPDNGLITLMLQRAEAEHQTVHLMNCNQPKFWREAVNPIFHGRDVFAPLGAYLAAGVRLEELGERMVNPVLLDIPQPEPFHLGWRGVVLTVDHFGSLQVNLEKKHLERLGKFLVRVGGETITRVVKTFGEGEPGELVAMLDSSGHLSLCVVNGSAADRLGVGTGEAVEVLPREVAHE